MDCGFYLDKAEALFSKIACKGVSSNLGRWIKDGRLLRVGRISPAGIVNLAWWWPWMVTKSSSVQLEFSLRGHGLAWERYRKEEEAKANSTEGFTVAAMAPGRRGAR